MVRGGARTAPPLSKTTYKASYGFPADFRPLSIDIFMRGLYLV